jgi:type I restriction enzyme M protein
MPTESVYVTKDLYGAAAYPPANSFPRGCRSRGGQERRGTREVHPVGVVIQSLLEKSDLGWHERSRLQPGKESGCRNHTPIWRRPKRGLTRGPRGPEHWRVASWGPRPGYSTGRQGRMIASPRGSPVEDARMSRKRKPDNNDRPAVAHAEAVTDDPDVDSLDRDGDGEEPVPQDTLICALTGEFKPDKPEERVVQSFIEQLHREYRVELGDMERDGKVVCLDAAGKKKTVTVGIAVYEHDRPHVPDNIIRVVLVANVNARVSDAAIDLLDMVLSNLSENRPEVYGVWTNGKDIAFRMRTYDLANGFPVSTELTDFPAPDETLDELDDADRRPLRVAAGDSLLRTFKHCHDYLSTQGLRDEKAFWQLLYLIFAKILDEQQSKRLFFVGVTERNTPEGQARIAKRIQNLFERVKNDFADVFDGFERLEMNERALAYVAAQLARYDLLATDTDAKGMAFEAITSHTLKQKKGQFFTPRNVIRMMVEMVAPQAGKRILDPACGSGGFLIVALNHARRRILIEMGCPYPGAPLQSEIKKAEIFVRRYARESLYGFDVDSDLRKAARMNMVMNGDGHGHIFNFDSVQYGVYGTKETVARTRYRTPEMDVLERELGVARRLGGPPRLRDLPPRH